MRPLLVFGCLIVCLTTVASAQSTGRNMKKEAMIWEQLKVIAPGSVEDFKAATIAIDNEKYDEAERLYRAVYKKAPNFDPVMRRLGMSLCLEGKNDEGIELLEKAVETNRNTDNLSALAQYLAYPANDKQSGPEQKQRAFQLIKEAVSLPHIDDDGYYQFILGQLALDNQDLETFRKATNQLSVLQRKLRGSRVHLEACRFPLASLDL